MPRLQSRATTDRLETITSVISPILEVVWQQPTETPLFNTHKNSSSENHRNTHTPEVKRKNDLEPQSPIRETSPQESECDT